MTFEKKARTLRTRAFIAIVIFALSFIANYVFTGLLVLLLVLLPVFLFSTLEENFKWWFIFGNSLNLGINLGWVFGGFWSLIVLIGSGSFWGVVYVLAAIIPHAILVNLSKCSNCGKRASTLYCQICGKKGCYRCMKPLFNILYKGDESSKVEVRACSEKCWSDFLKEITAHVVHVTKELWSEKKNRYAVNGPFVGRILASSYIRYLGKYPNNPHKEQIDSWFEKSSDQKVEPNAFHVTWFYNHDKYKETKPPYNVWFPYKAQDLFWEHDLEPEYIGIHDRDESHQDDSVRLFNELRTLISLKKAEFFPKHSKIYDGDYQTWDYAEIDRRMKKKKEELERARQKKGLWERFWDEISGKATTERLEKRADKGVCDYCSRDIRDRYYSCRSCEEVFCSQKCAYGHDRDVHDE